MADTASTNDEKFETYQRDQESGLDYAMNRYYASMAGRFVSADPYGGSVYVEVPASLNRYVFALDDPINSIDPNGLQSCASAGYSYNGVNQGTIGDIIASQSDQAILAIAMFTESGHGKGVDSLDEEAVMAEVIMNRWSFVNG